MAGCLNTEFAPILYKELINSVFFVDKTAMIENISRRVRLKLMTLIIYSKQHNEFLFPVLVKAIYESFCKTENEISNAVNYKKEKVEIAHG